LPSIATAQSRLGGFLLLRGSTLRFCNLGATDGLSTDDLGTVSRSASVRFVPPFVSHHVHPARKAINSPHHIRMAFKPAVDALELRLADSVFFSDVIALGAGLAGVWIAKAVSLAFFLELWERSTFVEEVAVRAF
jgi:hypothetical protein